MSMTRRPPASRKIGLRERKKRELHDRIFETATDLFRRQGFAETHVEEIAARVDISLKTFFNYFPTKQAVLDEHVARLLDAFDEEVRAATKAATGPVASRIRAFTRKIANEVEGDRKLALIVFRESKLFNADDSARKREHETYGLLAALFREGQRQGEFRDDIDAFQMAELFFAAYYLTTLNWLARWWPKQPSLSKRLDGAMETILAGCQAGKS